MPHSLLGLFLEDGSRSSEQESPWEEGDWRESKRRQRSEHLLGSSSTPCVTARAYIKPVCSLQVGMERKTASLPKWLDGGCGPGACHHLSWMSEAGNGPLLL